MPIKFDCPNCDSSLEMDANKSGQVIQCPKCRGKITVPRRMIPGWAMVGIIFVAIALIGISFSAFKKPAAVDMPAPAPVLSAAEADAQRPESPTWVMDNCTLIRSENHKEGTYMVSVGSRFRAFVERDSDIGERIYFLLKDGEAHKLILHVRFPQGSDSAVITSIRGGS